MQCSWTATLFCNMTSKSLLETERSSGYFQELGDHYRHAYVHPFPLLTFCRRSWNLLCPSERRQQGSKTTQAIFSSLQSKFACFSVLESLWDCRKISKAGEPFELFLPCRTDRQSNRSACHKTRQKGSWLFPTLALPSKHKLSVQGLGKVMSAGPTQSEVRIPVLKQPCTWT